MRKEKALDHFLRGQIVELIRQNPGATVAQILSQTDVGRSTLLYHLTVLEQNNYIRSKVWAGYRRFFPTGTRMGELPQYSTPTTDRVWELIRANPGVSARELTQLTGTTKQALHRQLTRLQLDERVSWREQERIRRWYVEE